MPSDTPDYFLKVDGSQINFKNGTEYVTHEKELGDKEWHFVGITWNGIRLRIFIDFTNVEMENVYGHIDE